MIVVRGVVPESSADCGAWGELLFDAHAKDDTTPPTELGYLVTVVSGDPPEGFFYPPPAEHGVGRRDGWWHRGWGDVEPDEPFGFWFTIQAVDRAGNVGPPSDDYYFRGDPFRADPDPPSDAGCRLIGDRPSGTIALAALAVLGLFLRSRRR